MTQYKNAIGLGLGDLASVSISSNVDAGSVLSFDGTNWSASASGPSIQQSVGSFKWVNSPNTGQTYYSPTLVSTFVKVGQIVSFSFPATSWVVGDTAPSIADFNIDGFQTQLFSLAGGGDAIWAPTETKSYRVQMSYGGTPTLVQTNVFVSPTVPYFQISLPSTISTVGTVSINLPGFVVSYLAS